MKTENPTVLRLEGLSDLTSAGSIRDRLSDALGSTNSVVVDIPTGEDFGIPFLQILVSARKSATALGRSISLHVPKDSDAALKLTASGIHDSVFPGRIDALPLTAELSPAAVMAATDEGKSVADQRDAAAVLEDPSIDRNALIALVKELGAAAVEESLSVFFIELEDRIRLLEQLSLEADLRIILREAHSLKGTAGTFGLRRLAEYGAELEREAKNLDAAEYRKMLGRMATMYETSRRMLPAASTLAA